MVRTIDMAARAEAAFDGQRLFQIAEVLVSRSFDRIIGAGEQ
jgi:hypothetical protein